MNIKFEELIISSGGNKGICLIGILQELNNFNPINKINFYTGCSVGALILVLINIGYTINELNKIIFEINFEIFQDLKIINLLEKCGLDEGIKITNFLTAMIINKNFNQNITFKELYNITGKTLTIVVTNITKGVAEYHNYINTPDLSVLLSLRMSINIPIIFSPIFYNDNYYLDGALLDPFPYFYNKNIESSKKIGLWLLEKYEINFIKNNNANFIGQITDSFNYTFELLKIIYINYIKQIYKKKPKNTIYIDYNLNNIINTFNNTIDEKKNMYNYGLNKCKKFFKNIKIRCNKRFLLKKYFNLLKYFFNNSNLNELYSSDIIHI
jgi:predicted patatin/cPLA2 family phospholipase